VIYPSIGNFIWSKKKCTFGGQAKKSLESPKTEFGLQNQYGRVIYPSIGNFTWSWKKYTFGGQKGENKLSEPKNEISEKSNLTNFYSVVPVKVI
jgi:hypothetical protein